MVKSRRRKAGRKPTGSCAVLKKKISTAKNKTSRGKALGAYAKAGCIRKKRRHRRR